MAKENVELKTDKEKSDVVETPVDTKELKVKKEKLSKADKKAAKKELINSEVYQWKIFDPIDYKKARAKSLDKETVKDLYKQATRIKTYAMLSSMAIFIITFAYVGFRILQSVLLGEDISNAVTTELLVLFVLFGFIPSIAIASFWNRTNDKLFDNKYNVKRGMYAQIAIIALAILYAVEIILNNPQQWAALFAGILLVVLFTSVASILNSIGMLDGDRDAYELEQELEKQSKIVAKQKADEKKREL